MVETSVAFISMRLSDFIRDTLYEIALGVEHARVKSRNLVAINPHTLDGERVVERNYVDFDVSVVVSDDQQSKRSGGASAEIQVVSLVKVGAKAGGELESTNAARTEQTHRVSFKVPVYMAANYRGNPAAEAEAKEFKYEI